MSCRKSRRRAHAGLARLSRFDRFQHRAHAAFARRERGSLARTHQDGEARLHLEMLSNAECATSSARRRWNCYCVRVRCGRYSVGVSDRWARMRGACAKSRTNFPTCAFLCWRKTKNRSGNGKAAALGIFIDINSGMNRTGIEESHPDDVVTLAAPLAKPDWNFAVCITTTGNTAHRKSPNGLSPCTLATIV